jgi:hypothetical protein
MRKGLVAQRWCTLSALRVSCFLNCALNCASSFL